MTSTITTTSSGLRNPSGIEMNDLYDGTPLDEMADYSSDNDIPLDGSRYSGSPYQCESKEEEEESLSEIDIIGHKNNDEEEEEENNFVLVPDVYIEMRDDKSKEEEKKINTTTAQKIDIYEGISFKKGNRVEQHNNPKSTNALSHNFNNPKSNVKEVNQTPKKREYLQQQQQNTPPIPSKYYQQYREMNVNSPIRSHFNPQPHQHRQVNTKPQYHHNTTYYQHQNRSGKTNKKFTPTSDNCEGIWFVIHGFNTGKRMTMQKIRAHVYRSFKTQAWLTRILYKHNGIYALICTNEHHSIYKILSREGHEMTPGYPLTITKAGGLSADQVQKLLDDSVPSQQQQQRQQQITKRGTKRYRNNGSGNRDSKPYQTNNNVDKHRNKRFKTYHTIDKNTQSSSNNENNTIITTTTFSNDIKNKKKENKKKKNRYVSRKDTIVEHNDDKKHRNLPSISCILPKSLSSLMDDDDDELVEQNKTKITNTTKITSRHHDDSKKTSQNNDNDEDKNVKTIDVKLKNHSFNSLSSYWESLIPCGKGVNRYEPFDLNDLNITIGCDYE